jgi:cytosine/creatinine deaminase
MDLKIIGASLPGKRGLWDVAIANGRILAVAPDLSDSSAVIMLDANGHLLIPGLVDPHFHLDKAFLLDRCHAVEGNFSEAMRETLRAKQTFTVADIQARGRRAIEQAIALGTTAMRSHVEVDPTIHLTGMEALLPLRDEYAWGITLQLAVFAQEGITQQPGAIDLLRSAMRMGGDLIGSAPYVDPDPEQNICIIFDLAEEFDCDVDFHLDFLDDDLPLSLPFVIAETLRRGWQHRVCLGHMTKLARLAPEALAAIAPQIAAAGISILALPASDLYMMSRRDTHNVRRGVAPIHKLAQLGVRVGIATNNVQNLFTPFGDGDLLKICTLLAQVLQLGTAIDHQYCLDMATVWAAEAIGISDYGIAPGCRADLVLLDVATVTEAIGSAPTGRIVIKHGKIVAQSQLERQLCGVL